MAKLSSTIFPELTENALSQLFAQNIFTVYDFVTEPNDKLIKYTDLTYKDICEIKKCILEVFSGNVTKASELSLNETIISTGIEKLDLLLNNGLRVGHVYEFCGLPSSGKSQLCLTIATNTAFKLKIPIHYIDTKKDFCATRVLQIMESKKYTDEQIGQVMNLIKVTRIKNKKELLAFLCHLTYSLKSNSNSVIIIDSLPAIFFKSLESNSATIALNQMAAVCKFLAKECQQVVITTNIISQWNEIDGFVVNKQTNPAIIKPTLGKYWLDVPDTRLLMEESENEERKISVWKSTNLKINSSCKICIFEIGVY